VEEPRNFLAMERREQLRSVRLEGLRSWIDLEMAASRVTYL
jgi:hypothetical protein